MRPGLSPGGTTSGAGPEPRGTPTHPGFSPTPHHPATAGKHTHRTQHNRHTTFARNTTTCTTQTRTQHTNKLSQQRQNTMASSRTGSGKWRRLRKEVIEEAIRKEQFNCPLCGIGLDYEYSLQPNSAEVDHILEHSLGGQDVKENVRVICRYCNQTRFHKERRNRKPSGRIEPETKIEW